MGNAISNMSKAEREEFERERATPVSKAEEAAPVFIAVEVWPDKTIVTATRSDGRACTRTMTRVENGWKGTRKAVIEEAEVKKAFDAEDEGIDIDDVNDALEKFMDGAQELHQLILE